ncbi:MAG: ABC transporter ATP-binding protein [Phycisphaeraceae bacterium]
MPSPDPSQPMIRTVDVRVDYDDVIAVQDMNLTIPHGEIFGLIGPNGAGKTSTIRVLATLQQPTYGELFIDGIDAGEHPGQVHRIMGYMPDQAPVYDELKVWEFLDLFAAAHFLSRSQRRERIDALIRQVDLFSKRDAKAGGLSLGMKQRLCIAKTLLHDPKVMLLDEPFSGIDPIGRIQLREVMIKLGREGRTILVSSHILTEMSEFCTSIGIMEKGRMIVSGRVDDIITQLQAHTLLIVELIEVHERMMEIVKGHPNTLDATTTDHRIEVAFTGTHHDAADLLALLIKESVRVKAFYEKRMDVEGILLKVGAREVS